MRIIQKIFFSLAFVLLAVGLKAQSDYMPPMKNRAVQQIVVDGDTMFAADLYKEVVITSERENLVFYSDYDRLKYYVKKVYPYARITADIIQEYDSAYAQLDRRRDKKKFMKRVERDLKDEFEDELKDLTITQGKILIKLIDRETGYTGYEIIKNLKGGLSAFFWQGVAKIFGSDLKSSFDSKEDAMIDYIVRKIERGEIYVPPRKRKTQISLEGVDS
ncbi:MAG: DUF4294 domain-containing protein [Luteibaculum sp.]